MEHSIKPVVFALCSDSRWKHKGFEYISQHTQNILSTYVYDYRMSQYDYDINWFWSFIRNELTTIGFGVIMAPRPDFRSRRDRCVVRVLLVVLFHRTNRVELYVDCWRLQINTNYNVCFAYRSWERDLVWNGVGTRSFFFLRELLVRRN